MNTISRKTVSWLVRPFAALLLLLLPLVLGSCSTSRLNDADRVLPPGEHVIRSVIDSDILIPNGSSLRADYLAGNRIFVQSGGTLSGLGKGGKRSTIYAEPGALVPALSQKSFVRVQQVEDAEESFNNRFRNLLPAGERGTTGAGYVSGGALFGGGFFGHHHHRRHSSNHSSRPSRSVSVKPNSYRSRN